MGFELTGDGASQLLLYGVGPSLVYAGVTDVMEDPRIRLVDTITGTLISSNDDWRDQPSASLTEQFLNEKGLAISDYEAGMVLVLGAGHYTLVVEGADGGTGIALPGVQRVYLSTDDGSVVGSIVSGAWTGGDPVTEDPYFVCFNV